MSTNSLTTAPPRTPTRRRPLGRYSPKKFGDPSRWRFIRDRRGSYLSRIEREPSEAQRTAVESLIALEWAALRSEADGTLSALREAREHRRLLMRLLADFERSIPQQTPRAPTLADLFPGRPPADGEAAA